MKKVIILIIAAIIIISGGFWWWQSQSKSTQNISKQANQHEYWQTYQNKEYGFEVQYPETLLIQEYQNEDEIKHLESAGIITRFNIIDTKNKNYQYVYPQGRIDIFQNNQRKNLNNWIDGSSIYNFMFMEKTREIFKNDNGLEGITITETGDGGNTSIAFYFSKEDKIIKINYSTIVELNPTNNENLFKEIINTLKFID